MLQETRRRLNAERRQLEKQGIRRRYEEKKAYIKKRLK